MLRQRSLPADSNLMVFSGNAHPKLAQNVCDDLNIPLGKAFVNQFSDGEVQVEIQENVRGKDVFVVQPTCMPTNDNVMELLIMLDALKRSSAERITAVMPYFGYSRQDRRVRSIRVPISAKVIANLLQVAGADRVLTVDLHADQIQGFFDIPVDNIYASPILLGDVYKRKDPNLIVVSPDVGGVVRARALAKRLDDADLAIIDKRRPEANKSEVMHIIGEVEGNPAISLMIWSIRQAHYVLQLQHLKEHGATSVRAYATHPVLSGKAIENIENSVLDELVVTDTIPLREDAMHCTRIRQVEVSGLVAESMRRINQEESVSTLYMD